MSRSWQHRIPSIFVTGALFSILPWYKRQVRTGIPTPLQRGDCSPKEDPVKLAKLTIENFRGIRSGEILFSGSAVLVGDNNCGKSTVFEAIDLVLGPERLGRTPVVDEHDFYAGQYIDENKNPIEIRIEAIVVGLSEEQVRHFRNNIEWWDLSTQSIIEERPEETDNSGVSPAIRVGFKGWYDAEDDDFKGSTFFLSPQLEDSSYQAFRTADKRLCGFLFLRTLRTGRRALSLERGSLLDIILRLQERRLQMWEDILSQLRVLPVAEKEELGITSILSSVQESVGKFVHSEWASSPHMRVSDLTRETLRRTVTVFMETGARLDDGSMHAAPFQHQGTGTINTLVLALLSQIAELKQNVIFAMEEPEIAIPPHTQKRIVDCIRQQSAQALFTSHSPYVLEEFDPANVLVVRREKGRLTAEPTSLPPAVKLKAYRTELKTRFCEALLARRVLIVEGRTEYDAVRAAARRLHELSPNEFRTLEALGIAVIDAQSDSQVAPLGEYFTKLGKQVFALFDKQTPASKAMIEKTVPNCFESPEVGFEDLLLKQCGEDALRRFAQQLLDEGEWPAHLSAFTPKSSDTLTALQESLSKYMQWGKGAAFGAELLGICTLSEFPNFISETLRKIQNIVDPPIAAAPEEEPDPFLDLI